MTNDELLERLIAQSEPRGADFTDLRAVIEAASEAGARRAGWAIGRWCGTGGTGD